MATTLQVSESVVLATVSGTVTGTVRLSPDDFSGPPTWTVTGVILQTSRPGVAPIPRAQVYRNAATPDRSLGLSYDGSFAQGRCSEIFTRGESVIVVWTGGQAGDVAYVTLTGTRE